MSVKAVVLDANILIRAVLGKRVREIVFNNAMTLSCPMWTEDADFFGTGIATWTTDRIELYFL